MYPHSKGTQNPHNLSIPKIIVKAEREVAWSSPDHILPWGTKRDNSRNKRFNQKLYRLFPKFKEPLNILDMGCSGGGFVKDCLDDGCLAIGIEGSDYSKILRRAEWATIPNFLFTCDATGDFEILIESEGGTQRIQFDVITCWEMIEHIAENNLNNVAKNVNKHLAPDGLWIMSVSPNEEILDGVRLHQTVQPKSWWVEKFKQLGFEHLEEYVHYFNSQYIRGPKYDGPGSFHLILSPDKSKAPPIPKESFKERIFDKWLGSRMQVNVRKFLTGS